MWIIGLFNGLPLIPWIETDYFIAGEETTLSEGIVLMDTDSCILRIEVPNYFPENNQCFDIWFNSKRGKQALSVTDFSITAFNKGNEITKKSSCLFWDNGSKKETFEIIDYQVEYSKNYADKKYVFFRTTYDVDDTKRFNFVIKSNFTINDRPFNIHKNLSIEKQHRWTWNEFRFH